MCETYVDVFFLCKSKTFSKKVVKTLFRRQKLVLLSLHLRLHVCRLTNCVRQRGKNCRSLRATPLLEKVRTSSRPFQAAL